MKLQQTKEYFMSSSSELLSLSEKTLHYGFKTVNPLVVEV